MKRINLYVLLIVSLAASSVLLFTHCKKNNPTETIAVNTHPYPFPDIPWFPTEMNIPADNPTTVEGVRLGRFLFYDTRWPGWLACDSQMSCSTCHVQKHAFTCGEDNARFPGGHPFGVTGTLTPHYMLPFINLVYHTNGYLWNGKVNNNNLALGGAYGAPATQPFTWQNIEALGWLGIYAPHEMKSDTLRAMAMLKNIKNPDYKALFKSAFGTDQIRMDLAMKAIAQFVRTLISYNSKYDSVVHLRLKRFTSAESRGYQIFETEKGDCFHCHGEPALLTNNLYMNNGLDTVFNDIRDRFSVTHDSADIGAYKVPTLRNIAVRGPFMRNGCFGTVKEVIEFYSSKVKLTKHTNPLMKKAFQGGLQLTDPEKLDLEAFLNTFTDYKFLKDTAFAKPADLDTGCP